MITDAIKVVTEGTNLRPRVVDILSASSVTVRHVPREVESLDGENDRSF